MDGFNRESPISMDALRGAGTCVMALCCLCSCAMLGLYITFTVYLGKYAFSNPNMDVNYWVAADGTQTLEPIATPIPEGATDVTAIHATFVKWFLWGFIQMLLPIAGGLLFFVPSLAACVQGSTQCAGFIWWIMGMVWRFSAAGKFASGDVIPEGTTEEAWIEGISNPETVWQYSSGNFMYIYYLITWILIGTSCGCGILGALCTCIAGCMKG